MEKTEITEKNPQKIDQNALISLRTQLLIFGLFASVLLLQYLHSQGEMQKRAQLAQASIDVTQGKYTEATDVFLPLALGGNVEAQTQLGFLYLKGKGFQRDKIAAAKWFTLAANQDQAEALYQLTKIYESLGRKFRQARLGKCRSALKSRFHTSSALAQSLGVLMDKMGKPATEDCLTQTMTQILLLPDWKTLKPETLKTQDAISNPKILGYLTKASELKNIPATFRLAQIWRDGEYTQKPDTKKAYDLFSKAAQGGHERAMLDVARMNRDGLGVTKNAKVALEWLEKAAQKGNNDAVLDLAFLYHNGLDVPVDDNKAMMLAQKFFEDVSLQKTADKDKGRAYALLGEIHEKGVGGVSDLSTALSWYEKAAAIQEASDDINLKLARAYALGESVSQDLSKALSFFHKIGTNPKFSDAATTSEFQKISTALKEISSYKPETLAKEEIPTIATVQSYLKDKTNITDDDVQSQYILGYAYENGIGVETSSEEAIRWYAKAAEHDSIPALQRLLKIQALSPSSANTQNFFSLALKAAKLEIPTAQKQVATLYRDGQGTETNKWEALKWFLVAASPKGDVIKIPRIAVDDALKNVEELYTNLRAVPYYENGKSVGFKILSVKKDSFFDKHLKLKRGDIWKSINGIPLDIKSGLTIFEKNKTENHFEVAMTRQGQDIKKIYEIVP